MTKIWALDWMELPADPVDYSLMPLAQLRDTFDLLKLDVSPIGITFH